MGKLGGNDHLCRAKGCTYPIGESAFDSFILNFPSVYHWKIIGSIPQCPASEN
jgi:hypothetical protein